MADAPEFFIDRSLGRRAVPVALRAHGLVVYTMADVYGELIGQGLKDEDWLAAVGERGWVVLMKDDAMRRRPAEREEMARRFVENRHRILRQAARPGPYIYGVYDGRIARLWPR